jgi:HlyD family secretion protein
MSSTRSRVKWLLLATLVLVGAAAAVLWRLGIEGTLDAFPHLAAWVLGDNGLPPGFAVGNGRIEATEVDVATKLPGRIDEVLVREGDRVEAGQPVARLDTGTLDAQLRQAQAEQRRAEQEREHALAVVEQRESELDFARRDLERLERLALQERFVSEEQLDAARTRRRTAQAALRAAKVQVVATEAAIEAARATIERIGVDIADSSLDAPRGGRVLYRLAEPGEVLGAGGKVATLLDLRDVYMVIFLPESDAGRVALGAEARIVLDAAPDYVIPASVSFVASRAQFTPKQVETRSAREKLAFRVKVRIDPALLARYEPLVKAGVPGLAYVRLDPREDWPEHLASRLPEWLSSTPSHSSD